MAFDKRVTDKFEELTWFIVIYYLIKETTFIQNKQNRDKYSKSKGQEGKLQSAEEPAPHAYQ